MMTAVDMMMATLPLRERAARPVGRPRTPAGEIAPAHDDLVGLPPADRMDLLTGLLGLVPGFETADPEEQSRIRSDLRGKVKRRETHLIQRGVRGKPAILASTEVKLCPVCRSELIPRTPTRSGSRCPIYACSRCPSAFGEGRPVPKRARLCPRCRDAAIFSPDLATCLDCQGEIRAG